MRFFILLALITLLPLVLAIPQGNAYQQTRLALQRQQPSRPWTRFRDSVIRKVWGIQEKDTVNNESCKSSTTDPSSKLTRYGGDVVLRFNTSTPEEVRALSEIAHTMLLDVWEFTENWVDIRMSKDIVRDVLKLLPSSLQHAHTPLMHDLAQAIFESYPTSGYPQSTGFHSGQVFTPSLRSSSPGETNIFFRDYQPLSVITPWMHLLTSLFPSHVRMLNIGISYEGRDIPALRVGVHPANSENPPSPRKTILITGGSHAREWISISTVNYVAYTLITAYGKSLGMTKLLEEFDWVFIPTINPDGYIYTWEYDRLWRKNRQRTDFPPCQGVDLDRSWGFEWDGKSTRSNPCSESFAGEQPFEAVESRRLADWAKNETENNNVNFVGYLDLHSYSQQVLYPYSFSCLRVPPSLENLEELAINLAKSIRLTNHVNYGVAPACAGSVAPGNNKFTSAWPRMESSAGSALDWFYHEMHVRYAYQIKLRDEGSYGFLLPRENIVPTGREIVSAVVKFGDFLLGNKGIERFDFEQGRMVPVNDEIQDPVYHAVRNTPESLQLNYGNDGEEEAHYPGLDLRRRRR
jgi:extracellular matrix protein 14